MYDLLRKVLSGLILATSAAFAMGQVATGIYAHGTFDNRGFDTINLGSLNMHFAIPVVSKPGRGLAFNYSLVYESSVWSPSDVNGNPVWTPDSAWGLHGQLGEGFQGYLSYRSTRTKCFDDGGSWFWGIRTTDYLYHDPFGSNHKFNYSYNSCTDITTGDGSAFDGSGYTYDGNVVQARNGRVFDLPVNLATDSGTITDLNGNQITNHGDGTFTDTLGVTALSITGTGDHTSAKVFTYNTTTGTANYSITYKSYTVQTAFGCSGISEYGPTTIDLADTITLGDGSSAYQITYESTPGNSGNVTGRIASITLPTGGTITYSYTGGNNGIACTDGSAAGLTRTTSSVDSSAGSTWTYSRSNIGTTTSHTDVTDGSASNHSGYDFVIASDGTLYESYETNRNIYQGAATGTPLLSRQTCYNGASTPCTTTGLTLPISQIDTYETLNGLQQRGSEAKYNASGSQTDEYDYDFGGASSRGGLLRHEVWGYNYGIAGLPTSDIVYDGSGSEAGETDYGYDGSAPAGTSGLPQHIDTGSVRGNLTALFQWSSSTGATIGISATYEDTGDVLTSTSPNGKTSYGYDATTHAFVASTTLPTPSSNVSLATSATADTNTGLPLSSTDPNSAKINYSSYDAMLRPKEIDNPDGGKTTFSYTSTQTSLYQYQNSSAYADTETLYDGYGRQSRVAVSNGQSGNSWYQQDTCYDANGRVSTQSYTYQGSEWGTAKTCSGDSYSYDALGRLTQVTHGDGSSVGYSYQGRATQVSDENGTTRITQVDGLGRITAVCEISSNSNMPGGESPAACGLDIAGTGFLTSYSYDLANYKTTVTHGKQTRTFQTDWLGRTILVQEPESGKTTYSYAYNTTGLVVTRKRPQANQQNASVLTTTTTQYDSLGRVVSISYDDGTPTKSFAYDTTVNWSDLSQANLKGRLSAAYVSGVAATVYSYDVMGRTGTLDECLPSGCGNVNYNRQLHYTYDWTGNMTSSSDGGGVTSSYTVSPANELLSLTSSLSDATDPASLVSNVKNGPNGPISYSLGNGYLCGYSYDALGKLSGGWVRHSGAPAFCSATHWGYKFSSVWKGAHLTNSLDSVLGQTSNYGYDEFNRLTSLTVTSGTAQNFTYSYDRYGNRWSQNAPQGGPAPQLSFNTANNQISDGGYVYDAAGNLTSDGVHSYSYDAEGNMISVDGGATAKYVYNALNQRVQTVVAGTTTEFVFNVAGQRVSMWDGSSHTQLRGQYYWGSKPVAFYANGAVHFQHQDWMGTERMRTTYDGKVEGTFTSLPFGDAQTTTSGTDLDASHYASLDHDWETNTDHAQFRQYANIHGRWMSPDPYSGSYDFTNPQSLNRYSYALNNPLRFIDPSGLEECDNQGCVDGDGGGLGDGSDVGSSGGGSNGGGDGVYGSGGDTPPSGYSPSGVNTSDGNPIYVDSNGNVWIGQGGSPDPGNSSLNYFFALESMSGPGIGGSGGGSGNTAPNTKPSVGVCLGRTSRQDGVSLGLDFAGFIPGESQVVAGVQIGVAVASTFHSAFSGDSFGAGAGTAGFALAVGNAAGKAIGVSLGKAIPFIGYGVNAIATLHDLSSAYGHYAACRN